jgi:hypothetical protein
MNELPIGLKYTFTHNANLVSNIDADLFIIAEAGTHVPLNC